MNVDDPSRELRQFLAILFFILFTLKLTVCPELSWLWVFAPLWIPFSLAVVVLIGAFVFLWLPSVKGKASRRKGGAG